MRQPKRLFLSRAVWFSEFPEFMFVNVMPRRPVDPIEANALQGGRMSLKDSTLIAAQTVISNGFGASVGLEAAYTQIGSGFASWLGKAFRLRRGDMRTLVACGSAGAIGAAFGAPLTGAFYALNSFWGPIRHPVLRRSARLRFAVCWSPKCLAQAANS
jgi:Voltage gated chloride channel